tara:strand:+ start:214 stop:519 length:306 start_codon:yes stop_codon:yes gene_type:complete
MSNYGDFKVASNVRIQLPQHTFGGGPWVHLATITRGLREYVVLLKQSSLQDSEPRIYLEEISATGQFHHIEDESLWRDLVYFATQKGLTSEVAGKEVIFAK